MQLLLVLALAIAAVAQGRQVRYDGFKVVRVIPQTSKQVEFLRTALQESRVDEADVWRHPRRAGDPVDISLHPQVFDRYYSTLHMLGLKPEVRVHNVQKLIDGVDEMNMEAIRKHGSRDDFNYGAYHKLDEVLDWMTSLTQSYPDMVTWFNITESYEKRGIAGIKISSSKGSKNADKPKFWIEGGIHAREWISPATVIYMTGQMLSQYKTNKNITDMVDSFDWYILPVFNVDGYDYTWTKNRNWRKTRSKHGLCVGVDPNRNWDYEWCKEGASKNPCSDTYCGPSAFSEVEVKGVADFIQKEGGFKGFIDFHSFSQLWMSPWGYTTTKPSDFKDQDEGSRLAVQALEAVYGTKYEHGNIASTIYVASGSSADWAYGAAKIKYSYAVELRDKGEYGFILPPDQIIPSGKETLEALIALASYVKDH